MLGHFGNGDPSEEDKQTGAELIAFAAMLERFTADHEQPEPEPGGGIISILTYLSRS